MLCMRVYMRSEPASVKPLSQTGGSGALSDGLRETSKRSSPDRAFRARPMGHNQSRVSFLTQP